MSETSGTFAVDIRLQDLRLISSRMIELIDGYFSERMGKSTDEFIGYVKQCEPTVVAVLSGYLPAINHYVEELKKMIEMKKMNKKNEALNEPEKSTLYKCPKESCDDNYLTNMKVVFIANKGHVYKCDVCDKTYILT